MTSPAGPLSTVAHLFTAAERSPSYVATMAGLGPPPFTIVPAGSAADLASYHELRRRVFVDEQGLFGRTDHDDVDDDPRTVVLLARALGGTILGGVRLSPVGTEDIGWWQGGRLVVDPSARRSVTGSVGAALVRSACARGEEQGALRFEATVQAANEAFFAALGWLSVRPVTVAGAPHVLMRFPMDRVARLVAATKAPLGALLEGLLTVPDGFVGDDGVPVPGGDVVAACDAIVPRMVERDPQWAGWCGVLVNVNDLAAMGATPTGLLDAVGAKDAAAAARVLAGVREASRRYRVPVLGGHTQLGVPAALSITALGRASAPVPGGGGRPGDRLALAVDTAGQWRPGYGGRQWDSTSRRTSDDLVAMTRALCPPGRRPHAAKDVSMAGLVGTLGMLAEASGCAAELDVAAVPRPAGTTVGDWFTCFPGFGLLTADAPDRPLPVAGPAKVAPVGALHAGSGVRLRWPDGQTTSCLGSVVTGLGAAAAWP